MAVQRKSNTRRASTPKVSGQGEFGVHQVDGGHRRAGDSGVRQSQVSEATDAEDADKIRRPGAGHLHCFVGGDAGAGQWCRVQRVETLGDVSDGGRLGQRLLCVGSIDRVSVHLLVGAEGLSSRGAVLAGAAGITEPGDGYWIALGDLTNTGAE